jgi:two-component system, NtrC family, response regulator HupR/HoxA
MMQMGDERRDTRCELSDGTELELRVVRPGRTARALDVKALVAAVQGAAEAQLAGAAGDTPSASAVRPAAEKGQYGLIGQSAGMLALTRMIGKVAGSQASVLITGENGTGKELVARAIHAASKRHDKAFVAVNCSAFNDNLLESEMFGHRRGAFTGAASDKRGLFEEADGGTLFLDEVGDMSPALQVKLLRVLQEGTFMPVGGTQQKRVDVRIVAATNRELSTMVKQGKFREDLYYRLHVVALKVPALRERGQDVDELVDAFLARLNARHHKHKGLDPRTREQLRRHRFPGNVRELQNEIERIFVLSGDDLLIGPEHLSQSIASAPATAVSAAAPANAQPSADEAADEEPLQVQLERFERDVLERTLRRVAGNRTRAAQVLGMSRRNLLRKLAQLGLGSDDETAPD